MRGRPDVKLLLSPSVVTPGSRLLAQSVLDVKSETPIDYVAMTLMCRVTTAAGEGENRSEYKDSLFTRQWRSPPETLTPGTHRFRVAFDLPDHLPATYLGKNARIEYSVRVHVSIPWWPDRDETFALHVVCHSHSRRHADRGRAAALPRRGARPCDGGVPERSGLGGNAPRSARDHRLG